MHGQIPSCARHVDLEAGQGHDLGSVTSQLFDTHSPAEEATARAALVFHHAVPVVVTQNEQLNGVGGAHHLLFQDSALATGELSVDALRSHTLPVGQDEDLPTLGGLHAAATERELLSFLNRRT